MSPPRRAAPRFAGYAFAARWSRHRAVRVGAQGIIRAIYAWVLALAILSMSGCSRDDAAAQTANAVALEYLQSHDSLIAPMGGRVQVNTADSGSIVVVVASAEGEAPVGDTYRVEIAVDPQAEKILGVVVAGKPD